MWHWTILLPQCIGNSNQSLVSISASSTKKYVMQLSAMDNLGKDMEVKVLQAEATFATN